MNVSLDSLLKQYLDVDGLAFCTAFLLYAHCIDDILDGDKTDNEFVLKTFEFAAVIYTMPFYQRNCGYLLPIIKMVTNSYADSVLMEKNTPRGWQLRYADVLRQNGNDLLTMCVEICSGIDARREFSMKLREISYRVHHDEKGLPV